MLVDQKPLHGRLRKQGGNGFRGDVAVEQPVTVLREDRMIPDGIVDPEPYGPGKQPVEIQPLRELVLSSVTYTEGLRVSPPLNRALHSAYLPTLNEPEI
jgi:hypothetical protein